MRSKLMRAGLLALALSLLFAAAASAKAMYALADAPLYKKNSASSKLVATVPSGTKVNVLATKKGWAKVKVSGKNGFMEAAKLTAASPAAGDDGAAEQSTTMYVSQKTALKKAASASSKKLATLAAGEAVVVKSTKNKWAKVTYGTKNGYVKLAHLSSAPVSAETTPAPATPAPTPAADDGYQTLKPGDSGDSVKKLQTRLKALEWFYGDIGGNYKDLTTQAVKDFQEAVGIKVTGIAYPETQKALYKGDAPRNVIDSTANPATGSAKEMDWWTSDIQSIFARGSTVVVTDVETKLSFRVYRSGGTNHADVQPKTAQDTAVMKKAYGGAWSWNRRAIWVSIGGKKYAASMNGMPHGGGSITTNDFAGHFCIHFTNSRTHGSNIVDAMHQAAIKRAAEA